MREAQKEILERKAQSVREQKPSSSSRIVEVGHASVRSVRRFGL
jgi:hypothetical protein